MKRSAFLLVLLASVAASSCATLRERPDQALRDRWIDRTEAELRTELGPPDAVWGNVLVYGGSLGMQKRFRVDRLGRIVDVRAGFGEASFVSSTGPMTYSTNHEEFLPAIPLYDPYHPVPPATPK